MKLRQSPPHHGAGDIKNVLVVEGKKYGEEDERDSPSGACLGVVEFCPVHQA
jgi:hypothetical protein